MGLKPCKECGASVSTDAAACPRCGRRAPTQARTRRGFYIAVAVAVVLNWLVFFNRRNESEVSAPEPSAYSGPC